MIMHLMIEKYSQEIKYNTHIVTHWITGNLSYVF